MSRFYWLRHGPTHQTAFTGWRDVAADLSDHARIARIAAHLPQEAVVVSSDLRRAVESADAICGARLRRAHDPNLREFDFGAWDGLHFSDVAARDPELSRRYWEEPGDIAPPGGESWNRASARVEAGVQALLSAHPGQPVVVVAHFGAILTQIARCAGGSAQQALGQRIEPLSLSEIEIPPQGPRRLLRVNVCL